KVEDALDDLLGTLQSQEVYVHEVSHPSFAGERFFYELEWCAKRQNPFDRRGWRNFYVIVGRVGNFLPRRQAAETPGHLAEGLVSLHKSAGRRIDQGNTGWHVSQDFFVEYNFPFEPAGGFSLPAIKPAA